MGLGVGMSYGGSDWGCSGVMDVNVCVIVNA